MTTVGRTIMHPKDLSIIDFTYALPNDRIAYHPLAQRDASKLLIYKDENIETDIYRKIAEHFPSNSLLVFNNTKVVEARLLFQKQSGGTIELFCLEPDTRYGSIANALQQQGKVYWQCLVGGASKWKSGQVLEKKIEVNGTAIILTASYVEKQTGSFLIELAWQPDQLSFAEVLHHAGAIPLPPYIKRKAELSDQERYQTIYAHFEGSVAAPTAGLHFTEEVFNSLREKNIATDFVTLHVGAGTFKPVKADTMQEHEMHGEYIDVSIATLRNLLDNINENIIAVGTTSLRTLESIYWLGVKCIHGEQINSLSQWEPYEHPLQDISATDALTALINKLKAANLDRITSKTQIIIAPGYRFRMIDALVTNFHQPQSTLLLLVAALIGDDWKRVYDYALENEFRFLSYGDGCLLWGE